MRPASSTAARADALFVSSLQRCEHPTTEQVRHAVTAAVRDFGEHGCAERVAQEFGDHPETAVTRMRWACQLAGEVFGPHKLRHCHLSPGAPGSPIVWTDVFGATKSAGGNNGPVTGR